MKLVQSLAIVLLLASPFHALTQAICPHDTLQSIANMPQAGGGGKAVEWNNRIYLFGAATGLGNPGVTLRYTIATNSWDTLASMPTPRVEIALGIVGDKVYCIGGYNNGNWLASSEMYDLTTNTWTILPDAPVALSSCNAVTIGNDIYFTGGSPGVTVSYFYKYETITGNYIALTPPYPMRSSGFMVVNNGSIYFGGGQYFDGNAYQLSSDFQQYDWTTDTWVNLAPMPIGINAMYQGGLVYDGQLLIIGGNDIAGGGHAINTIYRYDFSSDSWILTESLPIYRLSYSGALAYANNIYLFGGVNDQGTLVDSCHVLTCASNTNAPCPGTLLPVGISQGLLGYWPFCGNADDESGHGNDGVVNGAQLTNDRFGNANSAYEFDGLDDFIWAGLVDSLNGAGSATVSYWTNTDLTFTNNGVGNYGTAIGHWKDNGQFSGPIGLQIAHINDGSIAASLIGGQGANTAPQLMNPNQWTQITIVFDGLKVDSERVACYVNGNFAQYINVSNAPTSLGIEATRTYFGAACGPTGPQNAWAFFHGKLDDIGIWNRALSANEINQLYNLGLCFQTITVTDTLIINANITGFDPVTYQNTIKVFPNPSHDHITIDCGSNFSTIQSYELRITNVMGQQVFASSISQQQFYLDLSSWTGNGTYFVYLYDNQGGLIDVRKIIIQ